MTQGESLHEDATSTSVWLFRRRTQHPPGASAPPWVVKYMPRCMPCELVKVIVTGPSVMVV